MDGMGSRLGRASSRYGPSQPPPVFDGPVRKWKKQWVTSPPGNNDGSASATNRNKNSSLLLCRWTPLSSNASIADADQPPKRRFRYTPIVPIEKEKREAPEPGGHETGSNSRWNPAKGSTNMAAASDNVYENLSIRDVFKEETQEDSDGQSDSNGED